MKNLLNKLKNFWNKGKTQKIIVVIIAILIIGGIGGNLGGSKKEKSNQRKEEKVADKTEKSKETKNTDKKEKKTYHIGDLVSVKDVDYIINSMETASTVGGEYVNAQAQNMFLILNITIKNNENSPLTVSDSFFKLLNGKKEYNTDSGSSIYLGDESIIFTEINPDASLTGKIIFDISPETINSPDLKLQVQTGTWGTQKGVINLY